MSSNPGLCPHRLVGICAACEKKFAEARRAANPVRPLADDGVTHQGGFQRKRSDFYRGGTHDMLTGHDPVLLATPPPLKP